MLELSLLCHYLTINSCPERGRGREGEGGRGGREERKGGEGERGGRKGGEGERRGREGGEGERERERERGREGKGVKYMQNAHTIIHRKKKR